MSLIKSFSNNSQRQDHKVNLLIKIFNEGRMAPKYQNYIYMNRSWNCWKSAFSHLVTERFCDWRWYRGSCMEKVLNVERMIGT